MGDDSTGRAKTLALHSLSLRSYLNASNTGSQFIVFAIRKIHCTRNLIEKQRAEHLQNRNSCLQAIIISEKKKQKSEGTKAVSIYPLTRRIFGFKKLPLSTTGILHSEFHWVLSPAAAQHVHRTEQDTLNIAI